MKGIFAYTLLFCSFSIYGNCLETYHSTARYYNPHRNLVLDGLNRIGINGWIVLSGGAAGLTFGGNPAGSVMLLGGGLSTQGYKLAEFTSYRKQFEKVVRSHALIRESYIGEGPEVSQLISYLEERERDADAVNISELIQALNEDRTLCPVMNVDGELFPLLSIDEIYEVVEGSI